ncbi:hypothetical protein [Streptomyces sp. NPDC001226]
MAAAQPWKRPELADQPLLKKLNDELHDLRLDAGFPSARAIRDRVGRDAQGYWIVTHQAVLDAFQKSDLPQLGRVELIVGVLADDARRTDAGREVDRFKSLWKRAVEETISQASVRPPADAASPVNEPDTEDWAEPFEDARNQDTRNTGGSAEEGPSADTETPFSADEATAQFNYAEESLKGLIINAAQALWDDKDALRVFLGVVRRSEGFVKMADAVEERRPANATFYGVESREFEVDASPARSELVAFRRCLNEHRLKLKWSFTDMETQTGVSADAWIRWYTHDELPEREAVVAFAHMAHLTLENHVLLLGLWDAAYEVLNAQKRSDVLPSAISFEEAWAMRDHATPKMWALAGVGGDDVVVHGPDLASGTAPAFVVAGPAGSGRSTALVNVALSLLATGTRLVLAAPRPSPLRELADRGGVMECFTQGDIKQDRLQEILSAASPEEPIVIVMDDAEIFAECHAWRLLKDLLQHGFDEGTALVLGGDEEELRSGFRWLDKVRMAHRGLLLSPQKWNSGDLIGIRTGRSINGPVTPGRGWLHLGDGKLLAVTVPR